MATDDHNKLGTARLEKGEYDEAISEFTKVILSILPSFADAHYKRSLAEFSNAARAVSATKSNEA